MRLVSQFPTRRFSKAEFDAMPLYFPVDWLRASFVPSDFYQHFLTYDHLGRFIVGSRSRVPEDPGFDFVRPIIVTPAKTVTA
jgi:hypothetical protein